MPSPRLTPRLTSLAAALPATVPFTGPEALERARARPFAARLGANESAFGPSPRAVTAMERAARDAWMYGDPENRDLKDAIAAHHGIDPAHVVVGEGIDALLGYLVRLLVGPADPVVTSDGAYPTFNFHVAGFGGTLHKVPYAQDREDPAALLATAQQIRAKAPPGTAPDLDPADPRVIRLRTFSKGYGMAGARVGYAIAAKPLAQAFDKVRNHFGMSRIAQAGALAALADQTWLTQVRTKVARARDRITAIARVNGLTPQPSATNFVTLDCGRDGAFARRVLAELAARDIFIRMPGAAPLDRCIRISCGTDDALDILASALPLALAAADRNVT